MSRVDSIEIMSEREAESRAEYEQREFAIISITTPRMPLPEFGENPNLKGVFRMTFNDLDHDRPNLPAPREEDFNGLKIFIDNLDVDLLIVHCGAGISRSSATAAAVAEYLRMDTDVYNNPKYIPNRVVYRLAMQELGVAKNQEYFNDVFGES